MVYRVFMPKVGMSMETGVINKWLKKVGDHVEKGEPLIEIESDKVDMEIEANDTGYLVKITHEEGDTVPVIETIGYIATSMDEPIPNEGTDKIQADCPAQSPVSTPIKDMEAEYDVIVIGGGPAGYSAAIRAAQLGGKVLLFEKDSTLGGTCLNRGCIPTKAYLHSADVLRTFRTAGDFGMNITGTAAADMAKVFAHKQSVIKKLTDGVAALLKSNKVQVITAEATVKSGTLVEACGRSYTSRAVIYAGGSETSVIPVEGSCLPRVLDSTSLLDLKELPGKLVIIGGGVIGVEFACAFNAFGSEVTIVEMTDQLLPGMDTEIAEMLKKQLIKQGIAVHTSTKLEKIQDGEQLTVTTNGGAFSADYVLMAVGRKPNASALAAAGAKLDRNAAIVDDHMRTSVPNLYAAGDATGQIMLAHAAYQMAACAAENAMGMDSTVDLNSVPSCIYSFPEIACIGLTEKAAAELGKVSIGRFNFAGNGRALTAGACEGFVKVVSDASTHEILGIQIIGNNAAEMINAASVMLHLEMTAEEMQRVVFAHPSFSEALREACLDSIGLSVHNIRRK